MPRRIPAAVTDERPVPPPADVRIPEIDGVNVCVFPDATIVITDVRPLVVFVEVASVCVAPV